MSSLNMGSHDEYFDPYPRQEKPMTYWAQINRGILQNGHVRVGFEDCGKHPDGTYAQTNAELVERAVQMAKSVGRPIATAEEARETIELRKI